MATTVYAKRCSELKQRYLKNTQLKEPSFDRQLNALLQLASLGRLSRANCIWLGKRVHEMTEAWTSRVQREALDELRHCQERAWKRWQKRIAERAAAKEAHRGWKFGKPPKASPTTTPTPAPAPPTDIWSL